MATLNFTTSGIMTMELQGARFGNISRDPDKDPNVKSFQVGPHNLYLEVHDMRTFSQWGSVEVVEEGSAGGILTVTIDSNAVAWFGTAQFNLHYSNQQHVVSDNFQSGVGGTNSKRSKRYNIVSF
jgi:hypothetical protein